MHCILFLKINVNKNIALLCDRNNKILCVNCTSAILSGHVFRVSYAYVMNSMAKYINNIVIKQLLYHIPISTDMYFVC